MQKNSQTLTEARATRKVLAEEVRLLEESLQAAGERLQGVLKKPFVRKLFAGELEEIKQKIQAKRHELIKAEAVIEELERKELFPSDEGKAEERKERAVLGFTGALHACRKKSKNPEELIECAKAEYERWLEIIETHMHEEQKEELRGRLKNKYDEFLMTVI